MNSKQPGASLCSPFLAKGEKRLANPHFAQKLPPPLITPALNYKYFFFKYMQIIVATI